MINKYIAAPKDDAGEQKYAGKAEETYIVTNHEAFQLKTAF